MEYSCRATLEERTDTEQLHKWLFLSCKVTQAEALIDEEVPEVGKLAVSTSGMGRGPLPSVFTQRL